MVTISTAKKILGKRIKWVEEISADSEVIEVVLKAGYQNIPQRETVHVFGLDRDCSISEYKQDLEYWLEGVQPVI